MTLSDLTTETKSRPPGTLYIYTWRGRPVGVRFTLKGLPQPDDCPQLYDALWEIPVVEAGTEPDGRHTRYVPILGDWLGDILEED